MITTGLSEIKRRIYCNEIHYGFHFDLNQEILVNQPPFPLKIRPIFPGDISQLFYFSTNHLTIDEIRELLQRLLFFEADVPTCFVAAKPDQSHCALCWLLTSQENKRIQRYFKNGMPLLKSDEMLLEFVFVHPDYRGKKLMEWISKKLFVQAKSEGAKRAIAFVKGENKTSLTASQLIGWEPFIKKNVTWKFFRRQIVYESLKTDH